MNIFIIPSWYPSEASPVGGIFIKEQSEALADLLPENNFIISNNENFYLSVTELDKLIKNLKRYFKAKAHFKKIKHNLFEFYNPSITWTAKLGGEKKNIIKAHTENFLKALNKFGKIDIIHAHVSYPGGYAAMKIKEKYNIPYIITEHMGPFPFDIFVQNGKLSYKILKPLLNANRIIAVSNFLAENIKSFGIKNSMIIPNMVNENLFYPSNSEINKNKIRFLTVTTFIESKGVKELLKGILKSNKDSLNSEFIIAGTGPMQDYINDFIKHHNLSGKITLIKNPFREEIIKLFKECNVFILPSRLESFGIAYIEAMACGKPVIATDCGGPKDFIKDFNGRLISVGNPDEISEAIIFFTKNISSFSSGQIREFYLENYSQKVVGSKIYSLYKEVLNYK